LIGVSALLLWEVVKSARDGQKDTELHVTQFMSNMEQNEIQEFTVNGMEVRGKLRNGSLFHTTAPGNYFTPEVLKDLRSKGVDVKFNDANSGSLPLQLLGTWAPLILLGALWFFMIRQMQTGAFALDAAEKSHVQRRGRRGRGQGRAARDYRVPARGAEIPEAGRTHSEGRTAGRVSGNGQDAVGARGCGRGERSVLLDFRFGLCRNVCRRRRQPGARSV